MTNTLNPERREAVRIVGAVLHADPATIAAVLRDSPDPRGLAYVLATLTARLWTEPVEMVFGPGPATAERAAADWDAEWNDAPEAV